MNKLLRPITDWVTTKRGMWITIILWLILMIGLSFGPRLGDYKTSNFQSLPDDAKSIITDKKMEELFPDQQGAPGILVFHNENGDVDPEKAKKIITEIMNEKVEGVKSILDLNSLPPQVIKGFISEDGSTMIIPMELEEDLGNSEYAEINDKISEIGNKKASELGNISFYITGPAGIAGDTVKLFMQADFVLLLATIVIILFLLIIIYRSPLLALIPLLATAIVHQVVNQGVALLGYSGLEISNQTASIMSILLFAAVTDYSLFVFSRYREELHKHESKYDAMKFAMRSTGEPVFFAGGTVLAAMLILFFADFRDYQNFAPIFGLAMFFIILASITLVPALFTLFGRKSFWPKVPQYGKDKEVKHGIWGPIAKFVVNRPGLSGGIVGIFLLITAFNVINLDYEFDMVKNFPKDMPSRIGYEIVETRYEKGELAPTTLIIESDKALTKDDITALTNKLTENEQIATVRLNAQSEDAKSIQLSIVLKMDPYSPEAVQLVENLRNDAPALLKELSISGEAHFGGVTAKLVDENKVNTKDIYTIVILETLLILLLLFAMTRSFKMPIYMMATILISYISALGLGIFLVDFLFGYDAISTRVPVYSFIFLVALGIDYNIILAFRFLEERKNHNVKDALEIAIRNTGGVISSAGVILAATFLALTTMPIADLFVFGFIVAIGILIDTFLVRGMLLPSLILLFEKDKQPSYDKQ